MYMTHSSASHFYWQIYFGIFALYPQCILRLVMGGIMLFAIECHSSLLKSLGLICWRKGHSGHQCSRFCPNDGVSNGHHFLSMRANFLASTKKSGIFYLEHPSVLLFCLPKFELNIRWPWKGFPIWYCIIGLCFFSLCEGILYSQNQMSPPPTNLKSLLSWGTKHL